MSEFKPGEIVDVHITGVRVHRVFREGSPEDGIDVVQVQIPWSQYYTVVPLGDPGVNVAPVCREGGEGS